MCLGVPGKVLAIDGMEATVDFFGVTRRVRLDIVDEPVAVGDYILNHVGFAIRRIPEEDIAGTLELFDSILKETPPDDLMRADIESEIAATRAAGGSS
jgi:hydrogenase expression/formation protein HypC